VNTRRLEAQNDADARHWAGPFGVALLKLLRRSEEWSEAEFAQWIAAASPEPPAPPPYEPPADPTRGGVVTPVTEPAPPAEFYKRVTTSGRPGQMPSPAGQRDASGRYVRPVR